MKVLLACEESQSVCIEFRKLGHEAYSCDIQECSGGFPQWHIQGDVTPLLNGDCSFKTSDGTIHELIGSFDMIIAFPPCTHLAVSGATWFEKKRADGRQQEGIDFFMLFTDLKCPKVVIENPIGIMSSIWKEPTQIIQPYWFGDAVRKGTCLWLKGLQPLEPTDIVTPELVMFGGKSFSGAAAKWFKTDEERHRERSKTFPGVAQQMANQWGNPNWKPKQIRIDELLNL